MKQARAIGLLGKKIGMTQVYLEDGRSVPVTVLQVGPCTVTAVKTTARNEKGRSDGYFALQLAFDDLPARATDKDEEKYRVNRPLAGHFKKASTTPKRFVREQRLPADVVSAYTLGQQLTLEVLEGVKHVDVRGRVKGRGFQGVVRRHGFHGSPRTHGVHEYRRHPGSLGCRRPFWVPKGRRMGGHMGDNPIKIENLEVVRIDREHNLLLVKGAVPGHRNTYLEITPALKKSGKAKA